MNLTTAPDKNPQDLDTCLRLPVAQYKAAQRTIWVLHEGMFFPVLMSDDRQLYSRLCDPEMREVDEALLRALQDRPDFAKEMQVPPDLFQGTLLLESASVQLERSSSDLLGSLVDSVLVLRLGGYRMNGQVEDTVQALSQDPSTPWWQAQQYHAQWSEVGVLEHLTQDKASGTRGRNSKRDKGVGQTLDDLNLSQQDLQDLDLLDQAAKGPSQKGPAALPKPKKTKPKSNSHKSSNNKQNM